MRVEILEPERVLSNRSEAGDWVWTFALVSTDGSTRLISRNRIAMTGAAAAQRRITFGAPGAADLEVSGVEVVVCRLILA
jgi:hypothetical protein